MKKQDSSALFGVIGLGRFGSALARTLAEAGKEVIAVDCDEQKVKAIRKYTDYAFVVDDLSEEALTEVGIQNCGTVGICIGEQIDISILTSMLVLAVTLHNIPEGMAVGVVYAGWLSGETSITALGALALSVGIAIQNFPEGAIISLPLKAEGMKKGKAFVYGVLSGAVEHIGAFLTILAAGLIIPALPYLLSFAAGAMMYVVVEELIPEMSQGQHSNVGTVFFAVGFSVMMVLDVALG